MSTRPLTKSAVIYCVVNIFGRPHFLFFGFH